MPDDVLLGRARRRWAALAGAPVTFSTTGEVAVSPRSSLCPPGWVGIVVLGDAAIATAADAEAAAGVRRALDGLPVNSMIDAAVVGTRLRAERTLGPATLAFCDAATFRPGVVGTTELRAADDAGVRALLARVPTEDADESGLAEISSPAFVVCRGPDVVAAAGYRTWPGGTAHLSVLTAPAERGRGLARAVAAAAVATALDADLLPQWRALPEASRRVARALGLPHTGCTAERPARADSPTTRRRGSAGRRLVASPDEGYGGVTRRGGTPQEYKRAGNEEGARGGLSARGARPPGRTPAPRPWQLPSAGDCTVWWSSRPAAAASGLPG